MRYLRAVYLLKQFAYAAAAVFMGIAGVHAQASANPSSPPPGFRKITDETGRAIRIPQTIHRVVSLAPSLTETVYALGLQDRLVGDTDYCDFPPDAQQKPKVGGVINPSIETIASLHPDLVLVTKALNRLETVHALETLGIPSYATDPHTVDEILSSVRRLADLLGAPDSGAAVSKDLEQRLAEIQQRLASVSPRRVLFVVWTEPLISIGKGAFITDAIEHAGGVSVIDSAQSWPQVNLEEVVRLQPEFLIFAESGSQASVHGMDALDGLPGWRLLNAVRDHKYVTISDAINRPGPRIVSAIEELARQLHPEAFLEQAPGKPISECRRDSTPSTRTSQQTSEECACAR